MSRSLHPDHAKRDPRNVPDWRKLLTRRDERRTARRTAPRNAPRGFVLLGMLQSIAAAALSLSVWF